MPAFHKIASHDSNSVAAHFGDGSVGISVIHEPLTAGFGDANQSVGADSLFAITNKSAFRCRDGEFFVGIKDDNKIILGTMAVSRLNRM